MSILLCMCTIYFWQQKSVRIYWMGCKNEILKGLPAPQSIREAAKSKGVEVRSVCTETIFPLRDYVDKAG